MSHTIYILSGGAGTSGEQLVHTVLAQFPDSQVRAVVFPHVRAKDQLEPLIASARQQHATVVHTLVDEALRSTLVQRCAQEGICEIDLMGSLINRLAGMTGDQPLGKPGLYRLLKKDYYERVGAIEYSMAHDDGKNPEGWEQADVLLMGVSRVGKTPLCLYLSVLGWKAANYPLVPGIDPPQELQGIDPGRVIGLTIEPGQLVALRLERQRRMGAGGAGSYSDPQNVFEEVEFAKKFYRWQGFTIIDVTDKPIESTADEVIRLISGRFETRSRNSQSS